MAKPRFKRVCRHCHILFIPDWRNRHRQFYCRKPACRKARKVASQRRWIARNPDHFKHPKHAERVRIWREGRRLGKRAACAPLLQDRYQVLQDSITRNPFILGLLRRLFGCSSKDHIEATIRELVEMGAEAERGFVAGGGPTPVAPGTTADARQHVK